MADRDDNTVDPNNKLEIIRRVAESEGAVVVEHFVCSRCKHPQETIHLWLETLQCSRCKHMNPSSIPTRPQPGEALGRHFEEAIATYGSAYKALLEGREVTDLPTEVERTISSGERDAVIFAIKTLGRVAKLAEILALRETSDEHREG